MTIQLVIPINIATHVEAERLMDWIRELNNGERQPSVLLLYDDLHEEYQTRLRIAAELAFESVDELQAPPPKENSSANHRRNVVFLCAAEYCQKTYRIPWLYLDPTSVPTNAKWLDNLESAFNSQPKRYMGTHLKASAESKDVFLMPSSIYHMGVFNDCSKQVQEAMEIPYEITCGKIIGPKSNKWRLIQPLKVVDELDFAKVWPEAQIVVNDVGGILIEKLREDLAAAQSLQAEPMSQMVNPNWRNPEPGEVTGVSVTDTHGIRYEIPVPKIDGRTKEGRALRAKLKSESKETVNA